jgi:hypothetical protein
MTFYAPLAVVPDLGSPPPFTPYTDQFYGLTSGTVAGTVTIPAAAHVRIRIDNAGAGGARSSGLSPFGGNGGAYCEHYVAIVVGDAGGTLAYSMGPAGAGRVGGNGTGVDSGACSVTGTITAGAINMQTTAAGGGKIGSASSTISGATGGNVSNVSGLAGDEFGGGKSGSGEFGGGIGEPGSTGGGGGAPGPYVSGDGIQYDATTGGVARISFEWT